MKLKKSKFKKRTGCKYPEAPKDEDLITPIPYSKPAVDLSMGMTNRCVSDDDTIDTTRYMMKSGNYDVAYYVFKPTLWEKLKQHFRIWRMLKKIRKALKQK